MSHRLFGRDFRLHFLEDKRAILHSGSLKAKHIAVILWRDSDVSDLPFLSPFIQKCLPKDVTIVIVPPDHLTIQCITDTLHLLKKLPKPLRKIGYLAYLMRYPHTCRYIVPSQRTVKPIAHRLNSLNQCIHQLPKESHILLIGLSSGARLASLRADSHSNCYGIIAFGYPFQYPTSPPEPERYKHLEHLKTPMLLFQGKQDVYGGEEFIKTLSLSESISTIYLDTDHQLSLSKTDIEEVINHTRRFLSKKLLHPDLPNAFLTKSGDRLPFCRI